MMASPGELAAYVAIAAGIITALGGVGAGAMLMLRVGHLGGIIEASIKHQDEAIGDLKKATAEALGEIRVQVERAANLMADIAAQKARLDSVDRRLDGHDKDIDDIRRGESLINPLRSPYER
jgi:hypothetical protein